MVPVELILRIFAYLPDTALRRASRASRTFYTCAYDAGLSISYNICMDGTDDPFFVETFQQVVQYAVHRNLALRLSVYCFPPSLVRDWDRLQPSFQRIRRMLKNAIISAMPVLVYLSLTLNSNNYYLTTPLSHPMPRLRELELSTSMGTQERRARLPLEQFTGKAPLLRQVTLWGFLLGSALAPAFTNVTSLYFSEDILLPLPKSVRHLATDVPYAQIFPNLRRLELRAGASTDLPDRLRLDLAGVTLQSLFIDDCIPLPFIRRALAFNRIPVIRFRGLQIATWIEPENDPADFALRLVGKDETDNEVLAVVVPSHRRWRRIYDIEVWPPATTLPLASKRDAPEHLTYLRLDNAFLHAFLACNIAFPALHHIQVDLRRHTLLWPPDADSDPNPDLRFRPEDKTAPDFSNPSLYDIPCASLETLTVFALASSAATVQSREAAFLGRALGQLARPGPDRAVLALVGAEFAQPEASALLAQTFCAVRRIAFSGLHSTHDHDDGLWQDVVDDAHIDH